MQCCLRNRDFRDLPAGVVKFHRIPVALAVVVILTTQSIVRVRILTLHSPALLRTQSLTKSHLIPVDNCTLEALECIYYHSCHPVWYPVVPVNVPRAGLF